MSVNFRGNENGQGDQYEITAFVRRRPAPRQEVDKCSQCVATCCCLCVASIAIQIINKIGDFFSK